MWPTRHLRQVRPERIDGQIGYYSFDAGTPITAGTWRAASGQRRCGADRGRLLADGAHAAVFALCRPPGHHAAADLYGGYCFLNNAAIAAQYLIDGGAERVAILDVDYHHGNGTQAIFYERPDVLFLSLHGDPRQEYPFFLGWADERGPGRARASTSITRCPGARRFRPGRKRSRMPARGSPTMRPTSSWCRWASTPSRTTRSRSSGSRARISRLWRAACPARAADAVRDGGRLCGRADRRERRQRAAGIRGRLTAPMLRRQIDEAATPGLALEACLRPPLGWGGGQPAPQAWHRRGIAGATLGRPALVAVRSTCP